MINISTLARVFAKVTATSEIWTQKLTALLDYVTAPLRSVVFRLKLFELSVEDNNTSHRLCIYLIWNHSSILFAIKNYLQFTAA